MHRDNSRISGHDPLNLIDLALHDEAGASGSARLDIPGIEIVGAIGRGGMGEVYRGRQVSLDRDVAVKVLSLSLSDNPVFAERFLIEAQSLGRLNHPNVVHVHDFGQTEDGRFYLVMELVDGSDLAGLMKGKKMSLEERLLIAKQVAEGLVAAHEEGLIHRDVKPSNILVPERGMAKITDFGLTKRNREDALTLTATATAMGTPLYMAPEQKDAAAAVDHRADIFSYGVVLYELLTGKRPEGAFRPPSELVSGIPAGLDRVLIRALQPAPEDRYATLRELCEDLDAALSTGFPRSRRASLLLFAGLPVVGAFAWWGGHETGERRSREGRRPAAGDLRFRYLFPEEPRAGAGLVPENLGPVRDFALSRAWESRNTDRWSDSPGCGLAVLKDGSLRAWGADLPLVNEVPGGTGFIAVVSVFRHAIALREDGTVVVWGEGGGAGEAGPEEVRDAIQVAANAVSGVVLRKDGTVQSWGGSLDSASVERIGALQDIVQISARRRNGAALDERGRVHAWGNNEAGQCDVPGDVHSVKQVEVGISGIGALLEDGTVRTWGAGGIDTADLRPGETFAQLCWVHCFGWIAKSEHTGAWTLLALRDAFEGSREEAVAALESAELDRCDRLVSTSHLYLAGIERPDR